MSECEVDERLAKIEADIEKIKESIRRESNLFD